MLIEFFLALKRAGIPGSVTEARVEGRDGPEWLPGTGIEPLEVRYKLAEGLVPRLTPKPIELAGVSASASRVWRVDGQSLTMSQKVEIAQRVIPVDQVPVVHAIQGTLASRAARTVIFGE